MKISKRQKFISKMMLDTTPKQMFKDYAKYKPENKVTFYQMVCKKACLNQYAVDVQRAFNYLTNQNIQII